MRHCVGPLALVVVLLASAIGDAPAVVSRRAESTTTVKAFPDFAPEQWLSGQHQWRLSGALGYHASDFDRTSTSLRAVGLDAIRDQALGSQHTGETHSTDSADVWRHVGQNARGREPLSTDAAARMTF